LPTLIETAASAQLVRDDPWAAYDARVQTVLDQYWPETTLTGTLKVKDDKHVY